MLLHFLGAPVGGETEWVDEKGHMVMLGRILDLSIQWLVVVLMEEEEDSKDGNDDDDDGGGFHLSHERRDHVTNLVKKNRRNETLYGQCDNRDDHSQLSSCG